MTVYEFFLQAVGFFIQTAPVILLMCVSFDDRFLSYSRKKTTAMILIPDAAGSLGFAACELIVIKSSRVGQYLNIISNLYMAVYIVLFFTAFMKTVKTPLLNKLLVSIILIHYAAIVFTINNIFIFMFGEEVSGMELTDLIYGTFSTATNFIVTVITLPVVYMFLFRAVRPALSLMDNESMKRGCVYMFLSLLFYCMSVLFFDFAFSRTLFSNIGTAMFFSAFIVTDCIIYFMFFDETKLASQNMLLKSQVQNFDEQYRQISMGIEMSRRARHDIRHHLTSISTMSKNGDTKAISEYLEAYIKDCNELENVPLSGYHAFDNILRYYISLARNSGITVRTEFHPLCADMGFNVTDITVLAGNIMENAVEACEQLPDGSGKFIDLWIKQTDASLLIRVENSCRRDLEANTVISGNDGFESTKHSRQGGQEIKSICLAAEKYGGNAEFKRENGLFTVRVVLNIP